MYSDYLLQTTITDDNHALATIPPGFSVRQSSIPDAGLGVFAETYIPEGTRIGPYDGVLTKDGSEDKDADTSYVFMVKKQ